MVFGYIYCCTVRQFVYIFFRYFLPGHEKCRPAVSNDNNCYICLS
jgi:hypothetical protein